MIRTATALKKQYAKRIRRSKQALITAIIATLCLGCVVVLVGISNITMQADQYVNDVQINYSNMMKSYTHIFDMAYNQITDKIEEDPSFEELDSWLKSKEETFKKSMGENVYDGIAVTYKGGYAHSWSYGDYTDYDATKRRWYQVAKEADGKTAIVAPYVTFLDSQFDDDDSYILMSIVRKYNDEIYFDYDIKIKETEKMLQGKKKMYDGTELFMYDKNGYILSSSDQSKFAHNIYNPDDCVSLGLSQNLVYAENNQNRLLIGFIDGNPGFIYSAKDSNGNVISMVIPFFEVFKHDFAVIMLLVALMIAFEVFLYVRNRRSFIEFNNREQQLTAITNAVFLNRIYVKMNDLAFSGDESAEKLFPDCSYPKLFDHMYNLITDDNSKEIFSSFISPKALVEATDELYKLKTKRFSTDWLNPDGTVKPMTIEISRMFSSFYGKRIAFILSRDVSEDAEILKEALASAESASRAKSDFLSRVSHDIRTPMNTIINLTQMVEEEFDDKEAAVEDLRKIETSNQFLLSLVNDILDISRIEQKNIQLHPERYSYHEFLSYMHSTFDPMSKQKNIDFTISEGEKKVDIMIDKVRFNQMCFNLVSNAIKYTPPGGHVKFNMVHGEIQDGKLLCDIYCIDDGIGMSREFQEKMFDAFAQEGRAFASVEGTGLGLSIVKEIVDLLGATIDVSSEVGKGSTFHIHIDLPLAGENTDLDGESGFNTAKLSGKRLLVAEDHPLNQEIVKRLLSKIGVATEFANNGKEAVEEFERNPESYDAVIMDMRMPVMDGLTAAKKLRELDKPQAKTIPIIAMTANAFAEDRADTESAGMNAHLAKPIDPELLYKTLSALL